MLAARRNSRKTQTAIGDEINHFSCHLVLFRGMHPLRLHTKLYAEDSLMVHWDRPTTSATSRHHKLQVPLLLEMVENNSHKQQSGYICSLLPG